MSKAPPLRAHMILCLLGFKGHGYSPAFVATMAGLLAELRQDPSTELELTAAPDRLCASCPHLEPALGCELKGPGHEAHMRAQDLDVLKRLGVPVGTVLSWAQLLERVSQRVRGADLPSICTTCPWLPLGLCQEGVDALAREGPPRAGRGTPSSGVQAGPS